MPELPEVENVKRSLEQVGVVGRRFVGVELHAKTLRTPLKKKMNQDLKGQQIVGLKRRAKFIIFETDDFILLNHLGMTGSWRVRDSEQPKLKHDHVILNFDAGFELVYNDPRRFGLLELMPKAKMPTHPWLKSLGLEPFDDNFTGEFLFQISRGIKAPIKNFIMDQRRLVGVGNIYASEALFRSQIRPSRAAGKVKKEEAHRLADSIRRILQQAIDSGGSTIRDYRNTHGETGGFQNLFQVYDRKDKPCFVCHDSIRAKFLAGRNTYWCHKCQR